MKFLVDAQLPPELCDWLEERGHSAVHVGALAEDALRDWQIADFAEAERLALISKDEDFVELRLPDRFIFTLAALRQRHQPEASRMAWRGVGGGGGEAGGGGRGLLR